MVAILGAGKIKRLNCDAVSLQTQREVRKFLTNIRYDGPDRLRVGRGRIEYLLHAQQDEEDRQYQVGAEIEGSGMMRRLKIQNVDKAVALYGNVSAQNVVLLDHSLRDSIHDALWENDSSRRCSDQIDKILVEHGVFKSAVERRGIGQGWVHVRQFRTALSFAGVRKGQKPLDQTIPKVPKQTKARRIARRLIGRGH